MSEQCLICLRELGSPCIHCIYQDSKTACPTVIGQCGHKFHKHCITKWIQYGHKTCFAPDCGKDFIPTNDSSLLELINPKPEKKYSDIPSIRLSQEMEDIKQMENVLLVLPKADDLCNFIVKIKVDDGLYRGAWFRFEFSIPENYPNDPPKVRILDDIWHPSITLVKSRGIVDISCLYSNYYVPSTVHLCDIIKSIQFLLINPSPVNPMNIEASSEMERNYDAFKAHVLAFMDRLLSDEE